MKTVVAIIIVISLAVSLIGCQQPSPVTPTPPVPPSAPSSLTAKAVSSSQVELHWFDNSDNEEGFRIYRDNNVVATLPANVITYQDTGLKAGTTYEYTVKAYNVAGESGASLYTVKTLNPPITVTLDKIGVISDHDPFLKGAGDIYLYIAVSDGKREPQLQRIPAKGIVKLKDNETTEIGQQIFNSDCVGDELKIVAIAFEQDLFGQLEKVLLGALLSYLVGDYGASELIVNFLQSHPSTDEGMAGETPEDDFVGAIEKIWTSAEYWGIGSYKDVQSGDLRLWFTIESQTESLVSTETPSGMTPTPLPAPRPPEIQELSFELLVPKGEEYDEYSIPIYLRNNQTLHLSWTVEQGDKIWFGFLTPSGKYMGLKDNGVLEEGHSSELQGGVIVFKPSEHGWGEGYYEMKPHISTGGGHLAKAQVTVQYWIED